MYEVIVQDGMLNETYPQLSLAAEIFLITPISTATVERNFSTTNRILTKLRSQLTAQHVDQLMRITIEDADTLNEEIKEEIINYWKKLKPCRLPVQVILYGFSHCSYNFCLFWYSYCCLFFVHMCIFQLNEIIKYCIL